MTPRIFARRLAVVVFAVVLVAAAGQMRGASLKRIPVLPPEQTDPYLIPLRIARNATFGFDRLLSDIYWLVLVNYMGNQRHYRDPRIQVRAIYPLAQFVTELDPEFRSVYRYAALALAAPTYHLRVLEANCLLTRGMAVFDDPWDLAQYKATNDYIFLNDIESAIRTFGIAAKTHPRPSLPNGIAKSLGLRTGRFTLAEQIVRANLAEARDKQERKILERSLRTLLTQRTATALQQHVDALTSSRGTGVTSLSDLVAEGIIPHIPRDPMGGEFVLDEVGRVRSTEFPLLPPWTSRAPFAGRTRPLGFKCHTPGEPVVWNPPELDPTTKTLVARYEATLAEDRDAKKLANPAAEPPPQSP